MGTIVLLYESVRVQFPQSWRLLRICREGQNSPFCGEALSLFFWPSSELMGLTSEGDVLYSRSTNINVNPT